MFVLVHGAWHGRWCWGDLEAGFDERRIEHLSVDLPGRGDDPRPLGTLTLSDYADTVIEAIETASEPVTLVGHSLGGLVISQVAERIPDKLSSLVYLSAMLLKDGQSTVDIATHDPDSELTEHISLDDAGESTTVALDAVHRLFFDDCPEVIGEAAAARLVPEPIVPASTPVQTSPERWGTVPRNYIVCTQDRAISPSAQRSMIAAVGVDRTVDLHSSHSPFLSQPMQLVETLITLAD